MKTKLITLGLVIIILGGLGLWLKNNLKVQSVLNQANTNEITDWKTYSNTELGLSFKYPSTLFLTTDAPKDKYCNQPYDNIFLQNGAIAVNIIITTTGASCTWKSLPVPDYSFNSNKNTIKIFGTKDSNFSKQELERMVLSFKFTK